jgi:ribosome-associated protein
LTTTTRETIAEWAITAARTADDKKCEATVILEVGTILAITDFFVITSAANRRQVRTVADEIEKQVKASGGPLPIRVEGLEDLTWVLIDYGDLVVHIFDPATRAYYDLERLWSDVPHLEWAPAGRPG